MWLQEYLKELDKTTILVVAHDRDFLDSATNETVILKNRKLAYHDGAITACERAILKRRKGLIRKRDGLEKKRATIEKQIAEGAKAAKKNGDDNKARMVKSRQKKLDERFGADFNEKGHRFV
jgi:ATP-binding cassette, subfamily F, member 3